MKFLKELRDYNASMQGCCRAMRWFGALFHVQVEADILADAIAFEKRHAQAAYSSEIENLEADRLIESILADIALSEEELPKLRKAQKYIRSSAARYRAISEAMA